MKPRRIQLQRRKGWTKPDNTVVVSRPSPWGNPFIAEPAPAGGWLVAVTGKQRGDARVNDIAREINATAPWPSRAAAVRAAVEAFRRYHDNELSRQSARKHLGGRNLACWCPMGSACHVDVLLKLANDRAPTTCKKPR